MEVNNKKEKGFTSVDITVAILVMILFVSIMTSVMYSVSASTTEARRTATALNYAVDIFETIGDLDYSKVTGVEIARNLAELNMTVEINSGNMTKGKINKTYDYTLTIEDNYGDNYVKLITLTIDYKISAKQTEKLEMQRIKTNT